MAMLAVLSELLLLLSLLVMASALTVRMAVTRLALLMLLLLVLESVSLLLRCGEASALRSGQLVEGVWAAVTKAAVAREAVAMVLAQLWLWLRWVSVVVQDALSLLLLLSPASCIEPSSELGVCLPRSYMRLCLLLVPKSLSLHVWVLRLRLRLLPSSMTPVSSCAGLPLMLLSLLSVLLSSLSAFLPLLMSLLGLLWSLWGGGGCKDG